jgi:hypothetical protein
VDRLWSLAPWVYVVIFGHFSAWHPRLRLAVALSTLWGVRLSFNFWRKGGYNLGEEDYRWASIQKDLQKLAPKYHRHLWLARSPLCALDLPPSTRLVNLVTSKRSSVGLRYIPRTGDTQLIETNGLDSAPNAAS